MSVSLTSCWLWDEMWWDCMTEIDVSVTHILLDEMWWDCMAEIDVMSLTRCWSWDGMWWDWILEITVSVTHILLVMRWDVMKLHGRNKCQFHSHTFGHSGMRCDETAWKKYMSVSLTSWWSWDEVWWDQCMAEIDVSVTHTLLVMGWDMMRPVHGRNRCQCHSHAVGHGMRYGETEC